MENQETLAGINVSKPIPDKTQSVVKCVTYQRSRATTEASGVFPDWDHDSFIGKLLTLQAQGIQFAIPSQDEQRRSTSRTRSPTAPLLPVPQNTEYLPLGK